MYNKEPEQNYSYERLLNYSIWLLSRKDYCESQLEEKFKNKTNNINDINKLICYLKTNKYLDDKRYVLNFIKSYKNKESISKIKYRLIQKKINKDIIEDVINEINNEDFYSNSLETALNILIKKFKFFDLNHQKKYIQFLSYKGYSWDDIKKIIDIFKTNK